MNNFNSFSPTDFRYRVKDLEDYLSEEAFIKYKLKVEISLIKVLTKYELCPNKIIKEVEEAYNQITAIDVYNEEKYVQHDLRALVEVLKNRISEEAKPFIHLTATSYDIINIANTFRYKEALLKVILPDMVKLEHIFVDLAQKESRTLQIGRT